MEYSNKHLIEINCGFQFPEETAQWDTIYFGQFYEKIKTFGYTDRQERKGIQIRFDATNLSPNNLPITTSEAEDQVVFRNNTDGLAIILGKGRVSFHCVSNYKGWNVFADEVIRPLSEQYKSIGLGNGKRQCNIVYLNRFNKPSGENLSDYFTIISSLQLDFGTEIVTSVQRIMSNKDNLLIAKLNSMVIDNSQVINLECGAMCTNDECMNSVDWVLQANKTHEPILSFFNAIVTDKLKEELK